MLPPVTAPTHPPPPWESTTTTRPPPPPPPPSGAESEVPPKKRKLEGVGFQRSPYYTIRETVANLRVRFLQVSAQNPNILEFHSAIAAAVAASYLARSLYSYYSIYECFYLRCFMLEHWRLYCDCEWNCGIFYRRLDWNVCAAVRSSYSSLGGCPFVVKI